MSEEQESQESVGIRIRSIREALGLGRAEFSKLTGIPKDTLIGAENGRREPKAGILIAIAKQWPEYAAYLLTDATDTKQRNPEVEQLARDLKEQKAG